MPERIDGFLQRRALHGVAASRRIEQQAAAALPSGTLMQRAGLAVAKLALAAAPSARSVWIAAGRGNNGGDGYEAALHLQRAGRRVQVSAVGDPARLPPDAAAALDRARAAGVPIGGPVPAQADLAIDALLGLGASRAPQGELAEMIQALNRCAAVRLAVDLPSGLNADTGHAPAAVVQATHCLALLTLKPGLFTGHGREAAGTLWFDDLGADTAATPATAWLSGAPTPDPGARRHAGHKGRYGDVIVIGGAPGMAGALALAARAAVIGGAGRVFATALDPAAPPFDAAAPELMWRAPTALDPAALATATVVAGCGGGAAIAPWLPLLLSRAARLVLDADALNAIAQDTVLQTLLAARAGSGRETVLTPHPLEAARLMGWADAVAVQADRLAAAQALAERWQCCVLLKGSGSVIAAPGGTPVINPSGNARLASAGTGDVLAGWLGGLWSARAGPAFEVAQTAAFTHGAAAGEPAPRPLPASALLRKLLAL
jgi:ADP-dependent NAD(P)H-hydrate dehydratase / NAD(P)H-hydrate epimerase